MVSVEQQKQNAARIAVEEVTDGMIVGLGTGSTVRYALQFLARRIQEGLHIQGVPTSTKTETLAHQLGIPLLENFGEATSIDLTIDGADEVHPEGYLIKGGGGALTREKIVAAMSRKVLIIVDENKWQPEFGKFPLPVEVLPFGWRFVAGAIQKLGASTVQRRLVDGQPYITDNGNWILDCQFPGIANPPKLATLLSQIPGVVEHGLFIDLCDEVIIGLREGGVRRVSFPRPR